MPLLCHTMTFLCHTMSHYGPLMSHHTSLVYPVQCSTQGRWPSYWPPAQGPGCGGHVPQHLQLHLYATCLLIRILSHSIFNHLSKSIPSEIDQRCCYKTYPRQSAATSRAAAELLLLSPVWVARAVRVILVGEGQALVMRMTAAAAHHLHSLGHFTILKIPFCPCLLVPNILLCHWPVSSSSTRVDTA